MLATLAPIGEQQATAATVLYRVNAGGGLVSGSPDWEADTSSSSPYHNGVSNTYTTTATIDMSHPSIPSGTPMSIFQSERWDPPKEAEMQWEFPVPNGTYQVDLYFAEIYSGAFSVGARIFDVTIDGSLVLDNYDVYAEAGAETGIVESFTTNVTDSKIDIDHVKQNPAIKAIRIRSGS